MRVVLLTGALFLSALTALAQIPAQVPQTPQQPVQLEIVAPHTIDPAKEAEIRHLMDVTGANRLRHQFMENMTSLMKASYEKNLPNDERARKFNIALLQKMQARLDSEELTDKMIEIYDGYFSEEDIRGLIQFYESPVGQRTVQVMPKVLQESMAAGMQWAQKIMPEIMKEMEAEFPELKNWRNQEEKNNP